MTVLSDVAIRGSIVLIVGLVACVALRRHAPALRHAVLVVALGAAPLIAPIGRLLPAVEVELPRVISSATLPTSAAPAVADAVPPSSSGGETATAAGPVSGPGRDTRPGLSWSSEWAALVVALWGLGTAIALGTLLASMARLALATRRARPIAEARWSEALASATRAAGVRRAVALRESPRPDLLATWGWRTPCLLVPADALDWPLERIRIVVGHELAHVRRADWIWQILGAAVRAAFWWNPLAWLACRRLALESERACDDAVLGLGVAPHTYAEELVAVARALRVSPSLPAIAVSMARPSTLHTRITAMLDPHLRRATPGRLTTALLAGAVIALLVPVAVMRGAVAQAPLEGVVYDSTGAVVPDVHLSLDANGRKVEATTDAEGRFAFPAVEPGAYVLASATPGFKLLRQKIDLKQPADWTRVIMLQLGDVKETISVKGRRGSGAAAPAAGPVRVRVGGNIKPPMKLKDVKPVYPESAQEAGHEGVVDIEAVIGKDGSVTAARVTSPEIYPELASAALEAVRQWKFSATLLNGSPVEVVMNVSVSFTLE
jgi:TonB family protein